jgi:hypothetical protein
VHQGLFTLFLKNALRVKTDSGKASQRSQSQFWPQPEGNEWQKPPLIRVSRECEQALETDSDSALCHQGLGLAYGVLAIVKNAGGQHSVCTANLDAVGQMH